jgi:hypothetical protein
MKIGTWLTAAAVAMVVFAVQSADAVAGTKVYYTGQGFNFDGTIANLNDERCGLTGQNDANDGGTGQFANWNAEGMPYEQGQGYLVWVLTANGATSANLTLSGGQITMFKVGGTFKYASPYYSYDDLLNPPVYAEYEWKAKGAVQLVVSHGCQPHETEGAWCSPGYWRNAQDAAWALTGYAKNDLFNDTVVPDYYDTASAANPTLIQVLTTSGANTFGAASGPYGLNAFNATGAFLTANIPGYDFSSVLYEQCTKDNMTDEEKALCERACPIDNHGNFKNPQ